jgi:signal transduction histidine kinase
MNTILTTLLLAVGFINLLVAAGVFLRSAKGNGRWTFLTLIIATSFWAWTVALFVVASSVMHAQFYANCFYISALVIGSGLVVFGHYVAGYTSKLSALAWFVPPLVLLPLLILDPSWLVHVGNVSANMSARVTINQLHYSIYVVVFMAVFLRGWLMLMPSEAASKRHRKRQQTVSIGVAVSGLFGIVFNLFLPWIGNYDYIAIGPLFSLLFTMSITYAIGKYSLFDLRQTFVMSLTYLLASTTAALCYIGAIWMAGTLIASGTNNQLVLGSVYTALALVVAMTINPLKDFFDSLTAKLFLHERHRPEEALDSFGDAILDDVDISSIAEKVIHAIDEVVHPLFTAVVLIDKDNPRVVYRAHASLQSKVPVLEKIPDELADATSLRQVILIDSTRKHSDTRRRLTAAGIGVVARMQLKDQRIGYIVLGEKRNGDAYTMSETLMLSTMADESALAVMNSLRFDEIQKFNARLKHEITSATKELRTSNKKLLEMDATKDEFVSMASHQLRTPLTSVKGYISMVLEGDAGDITDSQRQLLNEAFASSERMVHLIGDFLNVSRLQTGKFVVDRHEVDLAKVTEQEVEGIRQIALSHNITLAYAKPSRIPMLYLDEGKMRQVIMNFIDNAVYYSPENTAITIKLTVEDGDVVLRVTDKGMGVPPEEQSHLFGRFFRAENARKQRPDGTGIGLYLAKKIIDGHEGKVVFESTLGKGSTFGFRLPIKRLSLPPPLPDNMTEDPKTTL